MYPLALRPLSLGPEVISGVSSVTITPTGGLLFSGVSERLLGATRTPLGGLVLSGEGGSSRSSVVASMGGLSLLGAAGYSTELGAGISSLSVTPSGGVFFSGTSVLIQTTNRLPSGGVVFSGTAPRVFDGGGSTGVILYGAFNDVWAGKLKVLGGTGALNDMINENTYWRGLLGGSTKPLNDVKREVLGEGQINDVEKAYWRDL